MYGSRPQAVVTCNNTITYYCRIRITKAAEFFKAVIPGMEPNMDKATAFHLTVQYMVFLRNALRQQDPTVIPKLHEVCGDAVNQAVQMVLWRFRPIASLPTEAKRVRLFYSGGGEGGRTRKFPVVGGELARGRNLQLLFNWWNRLLFILANGSSNGVRLIKESLYAYYLGKLRLSQPIRFLKNSNLFTSVFLHLVQGKCIYFKGLSFNGLPVIHQLLS